MLRHCLSSVVLLLTIVNLANGAAQSGRSGHLSTFRTESLKIRSPPRRFASIIDEAIWLMKTHFLKRHLLTEKDWKNLPKEYTAYSDVNKVSALRLHADNTVKMIFTGRQMS